MPDSLKRLESDVRAAYRHLAFVVRMGLTDGFDRGIMTAALGTVEEAERVLSRRSVFKSPTSKGVGGWGGYALQEGLQKKPVSKEGHETSTSEIPTERSEVRTSRETWLSPYLDAYARIYGGPAERPAIVRMGRMFKLLELKRSREVLVKAFTLYLENTSARYYSVEHFAQTVPAWLCGKIERRDPLAPRDGETTDAYVARLTQ